MMPVRKSSFFNNKKFAVRRKTPFNFNEFSRSFQSLDPENYGSWPLAVKITVLIFIVTFIAALSWGLFISSKVDQIKAAASEEQILLDSYREKESRARYLSAFKMQVTQMEVDFDTLLDKLPKETRVSEVVEGINMIGIKSNIRFQDISIEPEIENEFFIEQPIRMAALGGYHEFGNFISGLAELPRIITLHDFEVSNPRPSLDTLPELNLVLQTKIYRSKKMTKRPPDKEIATTSATDDAVGDS